MKKLLSNNKGFSLIELIVVIAILGVLVGVAAPNLIGYVEKTRIAADISTMENVKRAAEAYVVEQGAKGEAIVDADILAAVKATFPGKKIELKSKNAKDIDVAISYDEDENEVIVTPDRDTLEGKTPAGDED